MANICSFSMKVKGEHSNIENFYNAMTQNGRIYMGRGAEAEINWDDDDVALIDGWCKWSVHSAMVTNAISMRTEPHIWYWGEGVSAEDFEFITLFEACKKWNLIMEVYSEEGGCCFQEHYVCDKGDVICDECVEWNEYYLGEYETKEEAERELGIIIADDEWLDNKDDYITRGGFPDWYFEI